MGLRATYIMIGFVVVATVAASALILLDNPWMEPAQAVTEPAVTEAAVSAPATNEQASEPALEQVPAPGVQGAQPVRPNTQSKGDRLMAPMPPPSDATKIGPPSLSLESARQFVLAPKAGIKFRTVFRTKQIPVLLDDRQIASIKQRLKLTAAQEKYWPPVESAMRDLVLYMHSQRGQPLGKVLDPGNDQVKRMIAVSMPFLAQLREDQKSQIQALARMAGLGTELPGLKAAQN